MGTILAYIGPYCWRWTSLFGRAVITFDAVLTACYWACFSHQIACMMHRPRLFCILREEQGPESMERFGLARLCASPASNPSLLSTGSGQASPHFYRQTLGPLRQCCLNQSLLLPCPLTSISRTHRFYSLLPNRCLGPRPFGRFYQTGLVADWP